VEGIFPDYRLKDKIELRGVMVGASTVMLIFGLLAVWGMAFK
jgi:hypothetical protein